MKNDIKLVAVDMDGTFVRSDYTYDIPRFQHILSKMKEAGCNFVVASGNQYYQLRDLFPGYYDELSFVAENGAFASSNLGGIFAKMGMGYAPLWAINMILATIAATASFAIRNDKASNIVTEREV